MFASAKNSQFSLARPGMFASNPTQILCVWGVSETVYTRCCWLRLAPIEMRRPLVAQLAPDLQLRTGMQTNQDRQLKGGERESVLRLDAAAAKEVFSNCSQVFEALQFASFQMEYDPSQRNTPHTPSHLSKPQHTKKTPKQLAKNRLGKYIFVFCVFDVTYVFFSFFLLSVLCA